MTDVLIRREGCAGRITLARPEALNALTHHMVLAIGTALRDWEDDLAIRVVLIDAEGERAFCAGGDLADLYAAGKAGDPEPARAFWRDEYRMVARIAAFPRPVVSFLRGFTLGGGVGLGCHASHRIVCENTRLAMPEVAVGLVPDVGGTQLLADAPGHLGPYLGLTAHRMGPGDAIFAGFADLFVPRARWPALVATLAATGDVSAIPAAADPAPVGDLEENVEAIDALFATSSVTAMLDASRHAGTTFAADAAERLSRHAPLAMVAGNVLIARGKGGRTLTDALAAEYRYVHRALAQGDFLEGIRAAIIDRDHTPRWQHETPADVPGETVAAMLATLGPEEWRPPTRSQESAT